MDAVDTPRIVIDTNVCLDLFVFADPRCADLRRALDSRQVRAVTRPDCREEWLRVLERPQLRLGAAALACAKLDYDACLVASAALVEAPWPRLPRCADGDDQKFLELAQASAAIALISRDRELLVLSRRTWRLAGFQVLPPERFRECMNG